MCYCTLAGLERVDTSNMSSTWFLYSCFQRTLSIEVGLGFGHAGSGLGKGFCEVSGLGFYSVAQVPPG